MIILGILIPLYAFWSMSFDELSKGFKFKKFVEGSEKNSEDIEIKIKKYNSKISKDKVTFIDPFSNEEYKKTYDIYKNSPDKVFAYLRVPSLDIVMPIYLDASNSHLAKGAAHIDGTHLPVGGVGRAVIAGHRGYYKEVMFYHLDKLEEGDRLYIDRAGEVYEYEYINSEVLFPYEWDKLKAVPNEDIVTLLTCEPKRPPRPKRLIANFKRVVANDIENTLEVKEIENDVVYTKYIIYGITVVGTLLLLFVVVKFIKFYKRRSIV